MASHEINASCLTGKKQEFHSLAPSCTESAPVRCGSFPSSAPGHIPLHPGEGKPSTASRTSSIQQDVLLYGKAISPLPPLFLFQHCHNSLLNEISAEGVKPFLFPGYLPGAVLYMEVKQAVNACCWLSNPTTVKAISRIGLSEKR